MATTTTAMAEAQSAKSRPAGLVPSAMRTPQVCARRSEAMASGSSMPETMRTPLTAMAEVAPVQSNTAGTVIRTQSPVSDGNYQSQVLSTPQLMGISWA